MAHRSTTNHVTKRCDCVKWKTCAHPWYLDFQHKKARLRANLDELIDYHAADFDEAVKEGRRAIQAKLDGRDPRGLVPTDDPTLAQVLEAYLLERPRANPTDAASQVRTINATALRSAIGARAFGEWRVSAITTQTLREFRRLRPRVAGSRDLALLRAAFNLAILDGLMSRSPFRVGDVNAVQLGAEQGRTRRLHPGEEEGLLAQATDRLRDLITAALETGCRVGELLSLQWHQVRFTPRAEVFLPAAKTKATKDRRVPISTPLRQLLAARRHDPAGEPLPPEAYVFGDEIGRRVGFSKGAWDRTVLLAHGHTPTYRPPRTKTVHGKIYRTGRGAFTPATRAVLRSIDLHFHDLRREAGSRWMDAGVSLGTIQRWLGHANIAQTCTYLGASIGGDERDMRAFEEMVGRRIPVTLNDAVSSQTPPNTTESGRAAIENAEQNRSEHGPSDLVH